VLPKINVIERVNSCGSWPESYCVVVRERVCDVSEASGARTIVADDRSSQAVVMK